MDTTQMTGKEVGHAMAKQAADHAGAQWTAAAYEAFMRFARHHHEFTTEQVRLSAGHIEKPPTDKAWGQIAIKARRAGLVKAAGNVKVAGGRMVATLWHSNVFLQAH